MKAAVIGCGYVGLVTGVGLALKGHSVKAIEIDKSRVEKIRKGIVPFHEPGLVEALKKSLNNGTFQISDDLNNTIDYEVVLICVQTPPKKNGAIDLKILKNASRSLANIFSKDKKSRVVVIRSTVIPTTTQKVIASIFAKSLKTEIAVIPEFLREGSALADFLEPDRIVIGTNSKKAKRVLNTLYKPFKAPIIFTTTQTAEMAKYTSNAFLATLVSFSNEIAKICEKTPGVDVEDVLGILHKDRRFYSDKKSDKKVPAILSYLKAGCGFGGSCLPKDLSALIVYANKKGEGTLLLKAVEKVNKNQPLRVVKVTENVLNGIGKRKIAVLGAAFKGGTDDLRESPGLKIVEELIKKRAKVTLYDPLVNGQALLRYKAKGVVIAPNLQAAIKGVDACIVTSNAPQFLALERLNGYALKKHPKIIDGRRILKGEKIKRIEYFGVGRSV